MKNQRIFKSIIMILAVVLSLGVMLTGCATETPLQEPAPRLNETTGKLSSAAIAMTTSYKQPDVQSVSYVMLDINPSIELTIEQGVVTDVKAFNDDGQDILLKSDVCSFGPHDAIEVLIEELGNQGYINEQDEASLVITVSGSGNEGLAEGLRDRAEECVKEMNMECEVISATVSDEDIEAAKTIGMSAGRYLIIYQIAEEEGISFLEASEKYSDCKMEQLLGKIEDVDEIFEDDEEFEDFIDTLTEEQLTVLDAAISTYEETVMGAQKAFIQAGKDAQKLFKEKKKAAQEAFKANKDIEAWKNAKTELKAQFYNAKSEAKQIAQQAKKDAEQAFIEAISGLGLSDEEIADLLYFVFDFEWEDAYFDDDIDDDFDDDIDDDFDDDIDDDFGDDIDDDFGDDIDDDFGDGIDDDFGDDIGDDFDEDIDDDFDDDIDDDFDDIDDDFDDDIDDDFDDDIDDDFDDDIDNDIDDASSDEDDGKGHQENPGKGNKKDEDNCDDCNDDEDDGTDND